MTQLMLIVGRRTVKKSWDWENGASQQPTTTPIRGRIVEQGKPDTINVVTNAEMVAIVADVRDLVNDVDEVIVIIKVAVEFLDDQGHCKAAEEPRIDNIHEMFSVLNVTRYYLNLHWRDIVGDDVSKDIVLHLLFTSNVDTHVANEIAIYVIRRKVVKNIRRT